MSDDAIAALASALAEERAERQRLAVENADLRERVGRAEAERDAAVEAMSWTQAQLDAIRIERERRGWWRVWV